MTQFQILWREPVIAHPEAGIQQTSNLLWLGSQSMQAAVVGWAQGRVEKLEMANTFDDVSSGSIFWTSGQRLAVFLYSFTVSRALTLHKWYCNDLFSSLSHLLHCTVLEGKGCELVGLAKVDAQSVFVEGVNKWIREKKYLPQSVLLLTCCRMGCYDGQRCEKQIKQNKTKNNKRPGATWQVL